MARILIRGGRVITASADYLADVLIAGETITGIFAPGLHEQMLAPPGGSAIDHVIDATGLYVLPGGVDVHTHLDMSLPTTSTADDFASGTVAAACGGTTTVIDFANQYRGQTLAYALETWQRKAEGKAAIDYGFHMTITDLPKAPEAALAEMVREGITSFKLLMAYPQTFMVDDATIYQVLCRAGELGALTCIHAENGGVIDLLVREAVAAGQTAPISHARTRPAALEGEATGRAITLARLASAPVYIVHVSCAVALAQIQAARAHSQPVWGETCPQYLFLSAEAYQAPGFEAAKFVCTPPLRTRADAAALWDALARGDLQTVATDHCSFNFHGQKDLGREDFTRIPNGLPGVETRLNLLYHGGVDEGRLGSSAHRPIADRSPLLQRFVDLVATTPAKLFGLSPRKGSIAVGSDADLVLFDPAGESVLSAATHHQRVDYSPYEGLRVRGAIRQVLLRGAVVVENGQFVGHAGQGQFLRRRTL
jgi:dihydropyrimidinase